MKLPSVDFMSLLPIVFFVISSASFFISVQLSNRSRLFSAPFIFGFALFSLQTSNHLSWIYQGAASYWNLMICIWMHHALSVLFIESFQFPCAPMSKQGWILAYKIWADPQHQYDWSIYMHTRDLRPVKSKIYIFFALRRIVKIAICWYIELQIINPTIGSYFQFSADDFAPKYEPLIRRLTVPHYYAPTSLRELQIRSVISIYWIWGAYLLLDGANVLLSLFFVCIMRLDKPEEWRPLFGSISNTSSLRGFWGKFWHRLAAPSCASSGRLLTRCCLGLRSQSAGDKVGIAFWTFLMSAIIHAVAEWQAQEPVFPRRQLLFWLANFAAAALETLAVRKWRHSIKKLAIRSSRTFQVVCKVSGHVWVFLFFFWVVPKWQYPKLFVALTPDQRSHQGEQRNAFLELLMLEETEDSR